MHLQHLLVGLAHPALDGLKTQPLMSFKSVAAAEAVVHTVNQEYVNLQVIQQNCQKLGSKVVAQLLATDSLYLSCTNYL